MAADYDKLFRPHEGMEAPDDMAAQPFFDPSASFPPARTSGVLGGRPGRWFGRGRRRSGRSGRGFADWHLCPGRCWCGAPGLMWPVRGYVGRR